jgi:hypothetical protein
MERKGSELRDVAYAGGWKEPTTLLRIYQQPDPETLERVVVRGGSSERRDDLCTKLTHPHTD